MASADMSVLQGPHGPSSLRGPTEKGRHRGKVVLLSRRSQRQQGTPSSAQLCTPVPTVQGPPRPTQRGGFSSEKLLPTAGDVPGEPGRDLPAGHFTPRGKRRGQGRPSSQQAVLADPVSGFRQSWQMLVEPLRPYLVSKVPWHHGSTWHHLPVHSHFRRGPAQRHPRREGYSPGRSRTSSLSPGLAPWSPEPRRQVRRGAGAAAGKRSLRPGEPGLGGGRGRAPAPPHLGPFPAPAPGPAAHPPAPAAYLAGRGARSPEPARPLGAAPPTRPERPAPLRPAARPVLPAAPALALRRRHGDRAAVAGWPRGGRQGSRDGRGPWGRSCVPGPGPRRSPGPNPDARGAGAPAQGPAGRDPRPPDSDFWTRARVTFQIQAPRPGFPRPRGSGAHGGLRARGCVKELSGPRRGAQAAGAAWG